MDFKNIHIGTHIKKVAEFKELSISRACSFLKCSHQDILEMYEKETIETKLLLRWCKLLDYNFFMIYHTHLQLYSPSSSTTKLNEVSSKEEEKEEYTFKKNIYSPEIIDWLVQKLESGDFTTKEVMEKYNIPKTTIYRWRRRKQNQN